MLDWIANLFEVKPLMKPKVIWRDRVTFFRSGILKTGPILIHFKAVKHVTRHVNDLVLRDCFASLPAIEIESKKKTYFVTVFVLITLAIDLTALSLKLLRFFISYEAVYEATYIPYFSIKRPRRLFQPWHGGPVVCLNQQYTWARQFLRKGYYLFLLAAVYFTLKSYVYCTTNESLRGLLTIPSLIPAA